MSDAAPYVIAVAVGGIGDQCGYVLLAERAGRRRTFGPFLVESPTSPAADVWAATYEGIAKACRMPLATSARREVLVVLLGAVQALERAGVGDSRPLVAAAARALTETGSTLRWARRHESETMAAAHDALAEAGTRALREETGS